jgi:hypothetical protein
VSWRASQSRGAFAEKFAFTMALFIAGCSADAGGLTVRRMLTALVR